MLEHTFTFDTCGYDLRLKRDSSWSSCDHRLLVVLEMVPTEDLRQKELASTPTLVNCIKYARKLARGIDRLPEFSYAVINFNDARHLNLRGTARVTAESEFRTRALALIKKLNPTHILFSGDLNKLYPGAVEYPDLKHGWVHDIERRKVCSTFSLDSITAKDGMLGNLLGFFCRDLSNLFLGYHPYSLRGLKNKPRYVGTIEEFDRMYKLFNEPGVEVAMDTEDRNLSVNHNKVYTFQFAFRRHPHIGFVVPVDHPDSPFSKEERIYIKKKLREVFRREDVLLLTFNGKFDLRVIRKALKLQIIRSRVWEITAGEHLLDENISSLASGLNFKAGNLNAVLCSYDNDHYVTAAFGKEERGTIGSRAVDDPEVLEYSSMDAVCLLAIKDMQIKRAATFEFGDKNYQPYFINHMLYQMSDTEHQLSHLKEDGSYVSRSYLKSLLAVGSPLRNEIDNIIKDFYAEPAVQQANQIILDRSGFKSGSLFNSKPQWVFNLNKSDHKKVLFLEVLGLEPVGKTKTGEPAIDKAFINFYKDSNYVVSKYGLYQEAAKLLSTYVKGWYRRIVNDLDSSEDSCLRPDYAYFDVDTGRLCSKNPNLQNIPARGKLAKIIKRMFEAPTGYLLVRFDYSAHEVRGWSIVAGDEELASVFRVGQKLRQEWIQNPTPELKDKIKLDGDVHLQNVKRFFNKIVEKSHPLRDAVKAVVFGVIYGKGAKTLGNDTKKAEIDELRAKINKLYTEKRELEAQL